MALGSANKAVESAESALAGMARRKLAGRPALEATSDEYHLDGGIWEPTSWQGADAGKRAPSDPRRGQLGAELQEALREHRAGLQEAAARHEASLRSGAEATLQRLGAELAALLRGLVPADGLGPAEALRPGVPAVPALAASDERPGPCAGARGAGGLPGASSRDAGATAPSGAGRELPPGALRGGSGGGPQVLGREAAAPQFSLVARRRESDFATVPRGAPSPRPASEVSVSTRGDASGRSGPVGPVPFGMGQSELDGEDTGGSHSNRMLVKKCMEKYKSRARTSSHFRFQGARVLKARLKWVRHNSFDYVVSCIIIVNAVYLGVQTALFLSSARRNYDLWPPGHTGDVANEDARWVWLTIDSIFALVFVIEIMLRICAYQLKFFFGSQRWWNAFDSFTCFATVCSVLLDLVQLYPGFGVDLLKMFRLARTVRTLRLSRSKLFHTLKTLSYTVAGSANAFLSAVLLLAIVIFMFGTTLMQGLQSHLLLADAASDAAATERLVEYFGTYQFTVVTLLECVTGGRDWRDVSDALFTIGPQYAWFFVLYIVFTVLCVLNILNGVFVNAAIESAQANKELAIETTHHKTVALIEQMVQWFVDADADRSGKVSWKELRNLLADARVRDFLQANGIDASSAGRIYHLLDRKGAGELEPEEFVDNLIALQGQATAIDLASLRVVCEGMSRRVAGIEDRLGAMLSGPAPYQCYNAPD